MVPRQYVRGLDLCGEAVDVPPLFPVEPFWVSTYFIRLMPVLMSQYIMFVLISQLIHCGLRHLYQTRFVSNIIAALIMGPSFLGRNTWVHSQMYPMIDIKGPRNTMALMGTTLYLFVAAVKIDTIYMIKRAGKKALKVSMPSVVSSAVVMLVCYRYLRIYIDQDLPLQYANGFISFHLAFNSSPNLVTALSELNLMSSELERFTIFTAVITEFIKWILTVLLTAERQPTVGSSIRLLFSATLMVLFCVWVLRPWTKWIVNTTPKDQPVSETCAVTLILGAMVMYAVGLTVSQNPLVGPILFGLSIPSGPPLGSSVVKKAELVAEEIFLPFFYIQIGSYLKLPAIVIDSKTFYIVGAVAFLGIFVKFATLVCSARLCGFNSRESVSIGLMLNLSGLVTVYNYERLRNNTEDKRPINQQIYTSLILSSMLLNTMLTPLVNNLHNTKTTDKSGSSQSGHHEINPQSIQRSRKDSEFRVITCVYHESNISSITSLLEISNRWSKTVASSVCAYVIHMSKLDGQTAPLFGPHFNHSRICHHNGCDKILSAFNTYTRFSKEQVVIMPFTAIFPYKSMHEVICRLAKDKNAPLIILPFYNKNTADIVSTTINQACLRNLYNRMETQAHCTVGILLDKSRSTVPSLPLMMNRSKRNLTKYNVVVVFIGGADDREALAYGLRMLGHPTLNLTLLHIQMTAEWEMPYYDDDLKLVEEFRFKSEKSNNAIYHDIIVEGWEKAMEAIKHRVSEYDLVIVGQRQGSSSTWLQQDMMALMENPELGLVGDMLASVDFNTGVKSVLVLHHHGHVAQPVIIEETSEDQRLSMTSNFTIGSNSVGNVV